MMNKYIPENIEEILPVEKEEKRTSLKNKVDATSDEDFFQRHMEKIESVIDKVIGVIDDVISDLQMYDKPHLAADTVSKLASSVAALERTLMVVKKSEGISDDEKKRLEGKIGNTLQEASNVIEMSTASISKRFK